MCPNCQLIVPGKKNSGFIHEHEVNKYQNDATAKNKTMFLLRTIFPVNKTIEI